MSSLKMKLEHKPGNCKDLYIGDKIPQKKLLQAIISYARDVRRKDVIALFDDTLLGSATDGFLLTEDRLFHSYGPGTIDLRAINKISSMRDIIAFSDGTLLRPSRSSSIDLIWFAHILQEHIQNGDFERDKMKITPYGQTRKADAPGLGPADSLQARHAHLREKLADKPKECKDFYIGDEIPAKKLLQAIQAYASDIDPASVIALFDDTLLGSATEGFLISSDAIAHSYDAERIYFDKITSISSIKDAIVCSDGVAIKPAHASHMDLSWLCGALHEHIHEKIIPGRDLLSLFADASVEGNNIYASKDIPESVNDYLSRLAEDFPELNEAINSDEIILLLTNTDPSYGDTFDAVQLAFVTGKHIFIKRAADSPYILPLNSLRSLDLDNKTLVLKLLDDAGFSLDIDGMGIGQLENFLAVIKEYVDKYAFKDSNIDGKFFINHFHPAQKEESFASRLFSQAADLVSSNPFFNIISRLDGTAVAIIAFLRNNAPEKVLGLLEKLPGIGLAAGVANIVLGNALNWLFNQILQYGEGFVMEKLVENFKKRGISREKLIRDIDSKVFKVFDENIVEQSLNLLDKYMPPENSPQPLTEGAGALEESVSARAINSQNDSAARPGEGKDSPQYVCENCGFVQGAKIKFCPNCGVKFE